MRGRRDNYSGAIPNPALHDDHEDQALAEHEMLAARTTSTGTVRRAESGRLVEAAPALLQRTTGPHRAPGHRQG